MIADLCELFHILRAVGRRIHMILQPHFFLAKPRLIESAGSRSADIFSNQRIFRKTGKAFLSQQNFCTGAFFYLVQDL